jgi:hypothetical protein
MPFKSKAQRRLFHAALKNPRLRKKHDLTEEAVRQMEEEDEPGPLPERVVRKAAKAKASKKTKATTK